MSTEANWKDELVAFFNVRASALSTVPTLDELCFNSGKDPRLWSDAALRDDLTNDVLLHLNSGPDCRVLEVGCASGFLARLIAPKVRSLVGIDLASSAVSAARRLQLPNASFEVSDGSKLALPDDSFDAAYCYDVFINLPAFEDGAPLIAEMLRVVKPGGRVLIGSIPDAAVRESLPQRVAEVAADLELRFGPAATPPSLAPIQAEHEPPGLLGALRRLTGLTQPAAVPPTAAAVSPLVVTYDFDRADFLDLADQLGAKVKIANIHPLNPYRGYRFNAVYWRDAS